MDAFARHAGLGDCPIAPACGLPGILAQATPAFFQVLDRYTLVDLLGKRRALAQLFGAS